MQELGDIDDGLSCSAAADVVGEPLAGTAPEATGWVAIEDPGPWDRDALTGGRLPSPVAEKLQRVLSETTLRGTVRHQAIRRDRALGEYRTVFLAHGGRTPWLRRLQVTDEELLELDVTCTLDAKPPDVGEPHHDPVLLVCTHGRRDRCCAVLGRPTLLALRAHLGDAVWETSHTGGHRFAGNVIELHRGLLHGNVQPELANEFATDTTTSQIHLSTLRGRSRFTSLQQVAEVAARHHLSVREDVAVGARTIALASNSARVRIDLGGQTVTVDLERDSVGPRAISCDAEPTATQIWRPTLVMPYP